MGFDFLFHYNNYGLRMHYPLERYVPSKQAELQVELYSTYPG
jgi:hypothetical protein